MAKLVFAMHVSLDGYVDHLELDPPVPMVFSPAVLGQGKTYFAGTRPPLRLITSERIEDVMKLTYVPA